VSVASAPCGRRRLGAIAIDGDDARARHGAEFLRPGDAGEPQEVADRVLVGTPGPWVADIGDPLESTADDLEGTADGVAAPVVFLRLASGWLVVPEEAARLRAALLAYCQRETPAIRSSSRPGTDAKHPSG
jgi:hypothetical protein